MCECVWYTYALLIYETCKMPGFSVLPCPHITCQRRRQKPHLFCPHSSLWEIGNPPCPGLDMGLAIVEKAVVFVDCDHFSGKNCLKKRKIPGKNQVTSQIIFKFQLAWHCKINCGKSSQDRDSISTVNYTCLLSFTGGIRLCYHGSLFLVPFPCLRC